MPSNEFLCSFWIVLKANAHKKQNRWVRGVEGGLNLGKQRSSIHAKFVEKITPLSDNFC